MRSKGKKFSTLAIHAGEGRDPSTRAHNTPIYQTATFSFESAEALSEAIDQPLEHFFYSRTKNPTTARLEDKLAVLTSAEASVVTSSGMAAVSIATMISASAGDHVLVDEDLFIISREFFSKDCPAMGIETSFVDVRDRESLLSGIRPDTKALFVESVTNPNMHVAALDALTRFCKEHRLILIVDNTFLSPYLYRPLEHGADLVVHSATKYLSGHGDTVGGVLAGSKENMDRARLKLDSFGQCLSPLNAWLVMRGVRTLPMRVTQHANNALALASFLEQHKRVEWVRYPGLESHPQHRVAKSQFCEGFGGMLAFKVRGGLTEMNQFANALELCDIGVSLGDVYTLVYPKPKNGNLIRVSVGCEHIDDLVADFSQALEGD